MTKEQRILIYFDELVMSLTKAYGSTMDTHIYSPRDILSCMQGIHPVDAVEVAEYDAVVSKLENLLCHATGGKYSKAGYSWEDMERMVTDYIEECCEEAVAEEVVHGRQSIVGEACVCSVCHNASIATYYYCPECGAKMDGDGNG